MALMVPRNICAEQVSKSPDTCETVCRRQIHVHAVQCSLATRQSSREPTFTFPSRQWQAEGRFVLPAQATSNRNIVTRLCVRKCRHKCADRYAKARLRMETHAFVQAHLHIDACKRNAPVTHRITDWLRLHAFRKICPHVVAHWGPQKRQLSNMTAEANQLAQFVNILASSTTLA